MTQANGTVKSTSVFNVFVGIMLIVIAIFSIAGNTDDAAPVVNVDLGAIEARLSAIETNQGNTAVSDVVVDTSIMEAKIAGFENMLEDLMDDAYSNEVKVLKNDSRDAYNLEFGYINESEREFNNSDAEDDFIDELENLIPGFDDLNDINTDTDFGDEGIKYTIINLGLDDDDDKEIIVERLYNIRYELEDSSKELKADILVTGTVTYDDDEFEADLVFTLV